MVKSGARVAVWDRERTQGGKAEAAGATLIAVDVSDPDAVTRALAETGQRVGAVTAADDDVCARFEEAFGDDAADPAASAGDDHSLAGEVQWVRHSQASRTTVASKSNRLSESV